MLEANDNNTYDNDKPDLFKTFCHGSQCISVGLTS